MKDEYKLYFMITKNGEAIESEWITIDQVKIRRWDIIKRMLEIIIHKCDLLESEDAKV